MIKGFNTDCSTKSLSMPLIIQIDALESTQLLNIGNIMRSIPLEPSAKQALDDIIKSHSFLTLTDSKTYYPDSQGGGLPLLLVNTEYCSAVISLQGAQLLEYKSDSFDPLLWLSPNCNFTPGVALRGGVPLCLPWFGVHPTDKQKPKHGFARNLFWQLAEAHSRMDGSVELEFLFTSEANELFPYDFSVELRMILGDSATLEMTVNNTDSEPFDFSWAMHNYYRVFNLQQTRVKGLSDKTYKDNLEGLIEKYQQDDVNFMVPLDRVYPNIEESLVIDLGDASQQVIHIQHDNCPSVVVWNPGNEAAAKIEDIGEGQEAYYVCVERGAVMQEAWHLIAGASAGASMSFKAVSK